MTTSLTRPYYTNIPDIPDEIFTSLWEKYKEGTPEEKEKAYSAIYDASAKNVFKAVDAFCRGGKISPEDKEDMEQACLVNYQEHILPKYNVNIAKLSTYTYIRTSFYCVDCIDKQALIKYPREFRRKVNRIENLVENGYTLEEALAQENLTFEKYQRMYETKDMAQNIKSLDTAKSNDDDDEIFSLENAVGKEDGNIEYFTDFHGLMEILEEEIEERLTEKENLLFRFFYGIGKRRLSVNEIALNADIKPSQIYLALSQARRKLAESEKLRAYYFK